jgi:hypothetical protein
MTADDQGDSRIGPHRSRERFYVFADESATGSKYPCFGIGALVVPASHLDTFNAYVLMKLKEHGVRGEAHWTEIHNSHGVMNFALELWRDVLRHPRVRFGAIIVHKGMYRNWKVDEEKAFYQTYTYLIRHVARLRSGDFDLAIDDRSDSQGTRDEVLGIVSNHMLRQIKSDSEIVRVMKNDLKLLPGLQVVDLFIGAVTHAHAMKLDPKCVPNAAKQLLMERMADVAGWRDLYCDTMPESATNIWHFPEEWRATPETRRVSPKRAVTFVSAADLLAVRR